MMTRKEIADSIVNDYVNQPWKIYELAKGFLELYDAAVDLKDTCGEGCRNECDCTFYEKQNLVYIAKK